MADNKVSAKDTEVNKTQFLKMLIALCGSETQIYKAVVIE